MKTNPFLDAPEIDPQVLESLSVDELLGDRVDFEGPAIPLDTPSPGVTWPRAKGVGDRLNVVGLHGGAGATTVSALIGQDVAHDAGTTLPVSGSVLFVARTSGYGLDRAQLAARSWSAHDLDGLNVVGLVLVAALPKLPKDLRLSARGAARMLPKCWHLGFNPDWHLSPQPDMGHLDLRLRRTRSALRSAASAAIAAKEVPD